MTANRDDAETYEVQLVVRVKARMPRSFKNASVSILIKADRLKAALEKLIVDEFHDEPELVAAELRFSKGGPPVTRAWRQGVEPQNTKKALILQLLQRHGGVTTSDLQEATGWKPGTVSAQLNYLSKTGYPIDRIREDGIVRYRLNKHGREF